MATTDSLSEYVAGEIRAALARQRTSGRALAALLGVSRSWVSYRLTGTTEITLDDLDKIADVLDVDVLDLLPSRTAPQPQPAASYAAPMRRRHRERREPTEKKLLKAIGHGRPSPRTDTGEVSTRRTGRRFAAGRPIVAHAA
jgi:transcriptional regulator with XRE-family HTH domain